MHKQCPRAHAPPWELKKLTAVFGNTDDFLINYKVYTDKGVKFVREPMEADFGTLAVFEDWSGNCWIYCR